MTISGNREKKPDVVRFYLPILFLFRLFPFPRSCNYLCRLELTLDQFPSSIARNWANLIRTELKRTRVFNKRLYPARLTAATSVPT